MFFTSFTPFFLVVLLFAVRRPSYWAIATGAMAFFQGASPILIVAGGRVSGLAPAYCLVPVGLFFVIKEWISNKNKGVPSGKIPTPTWLIGYFTFLSVGGALLLPRLFEKSVQVLASGYGLDSGFTVPLKPTSSNYIQSFYLVLNLALVIIPAILAKKNLLTRRHIIIGVIIGAISSAFLGYYQLVAFLTDLPWPADILNSNLGVMQMPDQKIFGFKRMSATFLEPSIMAQHFLGAVGLILLGLNKKLFGIIVLIALLLSTSSSAYFGLIILVIAWSMFDIKNRLPQTIQLLVILIIAIAAAYGLDIYSTGGLYTKYLVFGKLESQSGESRIYADLLALNTLAQTYGLGAGIGSLRSSSFFAGLAGAAGVQGFILFVAFLVTLLVHLKKDTSQEARAIFFGLLGCLIGWALSVPDSAVPLFWFLAGGALIGYGSTTPVVNFRIGGSNDPKPVF